MAFQFNLFMIQNAFKEQLTLLCTGYATGTVLDTPYIL